MRRSFRISPVVAALALAAAACGDGPTQTTGDPLAEAEVQELAAEIFADLGGFFTGNFAARETAILPAGLSLSSMAPVPVSLTIDESGPCGGDGTASVNGSIEGTVDDETGAGNLELDITQSFSNCVIAGSAHTYTISGEPNIRLTGTFESDGESSLSMSFTLEGGFAFSVEDGRAGTCGIDVTAEMTVNGTTLSSTANGTICGVTVNSEIIFGQQ
jgi:hypothetical protein